MPVPTTIDHKARTYSLAHAYWLAQAADLSYKDEATIEKQARNWGFDRVRHHMTRFTPPFPLEDTQAFTMASDDMIITAFRGTEPARIRDWLSDATTPPWPGPAKTGYVHYGFGQALESIFPDVKSTLNEYRTNGQTVWFTGHSLGGALAMLAGARLYLEEPKLLADGVYTYGQPRTCDRLLAAACNKGFKQRLFRFVNNNDIVPQLPPEPAYTHADAVRYIDSAGKVHESMSLLGGLADRAKGLTADAFAPASDGVRDHSMRKYVAALEKNLA
ncbi:lipase family protein [Streptomyces telluris]|uniref:Lipase family protein n=1 Tax=Streptomyces telluris TaxID=2720021 RepID=A0A9X2LKM5_9ACTN|nr:lipase family protein [Streptomyces telluris]MCQ8772908.1 lipase family protein [Streptomyces telluris]NJP80399.1 lipase family protein [Streptomyces telluris]